MCRSCRIVAQVYTWQCGLLPPSPCHLYLAFLPMLSLPTPHCLFPTHPNCPQCVMLLSLCPCVLIVQHHLWVRTCGAWLSVLVSVCWEWWFPDSFKSLQRTQTHRFLWLRSIPWCISTTFSLSNLSFMGIWVGSRSLLLYTGLRWTYMCMCLYSRINHNPLGIFPALRLLSQMLFLFLNPWESTTLSSTMVELIYSHQQYKSFTISPYRLQQLLSPDLLNDHHSNWREMICQWGFDLHFSNDQWWWAFFHLFVGYIHVFFWEMSAYILHPLLDGVVCFFLVNLFKFFVDSGY